MGRGVAGRATKSREVPRYIKSDERPFLKDTSNDARVRIPGFSPCLLSVFSVLQSSLRFSRCFSSNTAFVPCLQKPLHKFSNSFSIWNPQTRVKRVFKYSLVFSR